MTLGRAARATILAAIGLAVTGCRGDDRDATKVAVVAAPAPAPAAPPPPPSRIDACDRYARALEQSQRDDDDDDLPYEMIEVMHDELLVLRAALRTPPPPGPARDELTMRCALGLTRLAPAAPSTVGAVLAPTPPPPTSTSPNPTGSLDHCDRLKDVCQTADTCRAMPAAIRSSIHDACRIIFDALAQMRSPDAREAMDRTCSATYDAYGDLIVQYHCP